jgi:hypothetical protein
MQTIKIFLASSPELDADKEQVELFISRKNKDYQKKMIFLELSTLKDFNSAMWEEHSEEKQNFHLFDIAIFLFQTKLGWLPIEEFNTVHQAFIKSTSLSNKPMIYSFFKNDAKETFDFLEFKNYAETNILNYKVFASLEELFIELSSEIEVFKHDNRICFSETTFMDFQKNGNVDEQMPIAFGCVSINTDLHNDFVNSVLCACVDFQENGQVDEQMTIPFGCDSVNSDLLRSILML